MNRNGDRGANSTTTAVFRVEGMTCSACERRIEEAAKRLEGVLRCTADRGGSTVRVTYRRGGASESDIARAIEKSGYRLSRIEGKAPGFDLKQLVGIGAAIAILFLIFQKTGLLARIPQVDQSMSYGLLLVAGLLTSFHCVAMCGGINVSQSIGGGRAARDGALARVKPALLYNTGRIVSYTAIGGMVGALGSVLSFSGRTKGFLVVAVGAVMVLMGLKMLNLFPRLRIPLPRLFRGSTRGGEGTARSGGPLVVGLLNGFMPCGPLQAMQLYALGTGSFSLGAFSMFLFSLGTVPLMFGMGALSSLLSRRFANTVLKASAMLVLVLGVGTLGRGMSLSGARLKVPAGKAAGKAAGAAGNVAVVEGGYQTVRTDLEPGRYAPIIVQKGLPVRWTIDAKEEALNGCNNPVTIPEYGIVRTLVPGRNVVEFTPAETGDVTYTCWMGMISSVIRVVDDVTAVKGREARSLAGGGARSVAKPGKGASPGGNRRSTASGVPAGSAGPAGRAAGCCPAGGGPGTGSGSPSDGFDIPTKKIAFATLGDGVQHVSIDALKKGYSPAVVVVQRGVPVKWVFNGRELTDDNYRVVFPAYRAKVELAAGQNTIEFTPEIDFVFYSWRRSYAGFVDVVDSLAAADEREVRADVSRFVEYRGNDS